MRHSRARRRTLLDPVEFSWKRFFIATGVASSFAPLLEDAPPPMRGHTLVGLVPLIYIVLWGHAILPKDAHANVERFLILALQMALLVGALLGLVIVALIRTRKLLLQTYTAR